MESNKEQLKLLEEARLVNNILKTVEEIRNGNIAEIYHELISE